MDLCKIQVELSFEGQFDTFKPMFVLHTLGKSIVVFERNFFASSFFRNTIFNGLILSLGIGLGTYNLDSLGFFVSHERTVDIFNGLGSATCKSLSLTRLLILELHE